MMLTWKRFFSPAFIFNGDKLEEEKKENLHFALTLLDNVIHPVGLIHTLGGI